MPWPLVNVALDVPWFLPCSVHVKLPPRPTTPETLFDLVTTRSGALRVVTAVGVLFAGVSSFGDDTVALFEIEPVPNVAGAVTVIVMFCATLLGDVAERFPPVRLHVTVPDTFAQLQLVPVALTNVVPDGIVSTTLTAEASSGPLFVTPIVYV